MQKVTFYCDRCGRETEEPYKIIGHKIDRHTGDYLTDEGGNLEFCKWCYASIMSDITDNIKGDLEEVEEDEDDELPFCDPEDDLEEEKPEEDPEIKEKIRRRLPIEKTFDIGKMKSLRRAGWSLKKIADEMNCAPQTVANKLKKEGVK